MLLNPSEFIENLEENFETIESGTVKSESGNVVGGDDLFEFMYKEIDLGEKTVAEVFLVENVNGYIDQLSGLK